MIEDDDVGSESSFIAQCLAPDISNEDQEANMEPVDGHEYLRSVMREAKQFQCVQEAKNAERLLQRRHSLTNDHNLDDVDDDNGKSSSPFLKPSPEWQRWQLRHFSHLRLKMERHIQLTEEERKKDGHRSHEIKKHKFPKKDDEKGWCLYCQGPSLWRRLDEETSHPSKGQSNSVHSEEETHSGHQPLTSILAQLRPTAVNDLIDMHVEWAESVGLVDTNIAMWLFALMIRLEKPLVPETQSSLRSLAKLCRRQRWSMVKPSDKNDDNRGDESEDNLGNKADLLKRDDELSTSVRQLSLLICLVSKYFGQSDLADT